MPSSASLSWPSKAGICERGRPQRLEAVDDASHRGHCKEAPPSEQGSGGTAQVRKRRTSSAPLLKTGKSYFFPEALNFLQQDDLVHDRESVVGHTSSKDSAHNVVANVITDDASKMCAAFTSGAATRHVDTGWGALQGEVRKPMYRMYKFRKQTKV